MEDLFSPLDLLFDELVLTDGRSGRSGRDAKAYEDFGFGRAAAITGLDVDSLSRTRAELRLRLALHLSPRAAIAYESDNPTPRWKLVREHLVDQMGRDAEGAERLARAIAVLLDNWDRRRAPVTAHREALRRRDGGRCACCHVDFGGISLALIAADDYKPYHLAPDELTREEVDHIDPISGLGTNVLSNFQLVCRLCNAGKGDGLGVSASVEAEHAGTRLGEIPRAHRARVFYSVLQRDGFVCRDCQSGTSELTIRPLVEGGGYVRSNLRAVCVECAGLSGDEHAIQSVTRGDPT